MAHHPCRLFAAASCAVMLGGCGGNAAPTSAAPAVITIKNFSFGPASLHVAVGTRITVTNDDPSVHTATAVGGGFDSGDIAPGQSVTITLATPGTYSYRCSIHQYMTGTVTAG